jgi:hypothetical protein
LQKVDEPKGHAFLLRLKKEDFWQEVVLEITAYIEIQRQKRWRSLSRGREDDRGQVNYKDALLVVIP